MFRRLGSDEAVNETLKRYSNSESKLVSRYI